MAGRYDGNPSEEDDLHPLSEQERGKADGQSNFGGGTLYIPNPRNVPPASNSRLSLLPPEPADLSGTVEVDIPLDSSKDLEKMEKERQARESKLKKREKNPRNVPPASNSRLSPLPPEPADLRATVGTPLDLSKDLKKMEKERQAREAELNKGEKNPRNVPPASSSCLSQLPPEQPDLNADIPLHLSKDLKRREKELEAREEDLVKRDKELLKKCQFLTLHAIRNFLYQEKNCPLLADLEQIFEKYDNKWCNDFGNAKSKFETSVAEIYKRNISDLKSELLSAVAEKGNPLTEKGAVEVLSRGLTADVKSMKKVVKERCAKNRSDVQDVAIIYDERMLEHKPPKGKLLFKIYEVPERLSKIKDRLLRDGLWQRCQIFECDEAEMESLEAVHDPSHVSDVKRISFQGKETVDDDIYYSSGTTLAALLAAGGVIKAADLVAKGEVKASFAIVRPPGHHVGVNGPPNGFCFLNNVSIAAAHLLEKHGMKKILLLDWDIHHGDGTQQIFYSNERVLFFSVHRGDEEMFPSEAQRTLDYLGEGSGLGYNINICWPHKKIRDVDYYVLWDHVLVPICEEFKPEIILISAGFDAAKGDDLGKCDVTPNGFASLLRKLKPLAPIVMALEGGYNLTAISQAAAACLKVLLGDKSETVRDRSLPYSTTMSVILEAKEKLKPYWKCMESVIPEDVKKRTIAPKTTKNNHKKPAGTSAPG